MIKYKIDILAALKEKGYTQTKLLTENLLSGNTVTNLRKGKLINLDSINKICILLRCQPGDLLECVPTDGEKIKYF